MSRSERAAPAAFAPSSPNAEGCNHTHRARSHTPRSRAVQSLRRVAAAARRGRSSRRASPSWTSVSVFAAGCTARARPRHAAPGRATCTRPRHAARGGARATRHAACDTRIRSHRRVRRGCRACLTILAGSRAGGRGPNRSCAAAAPSLFGVRSKRRARTRRCSSARTRRSWCAARRSHARGSWYGVVPCCTLRGRRGSKRSSIPQSARSSR
jgi:hypothetical protein